MLGLEPVRVHPAPERALDLNVTKLLPFHVVTVLGDPAAPEGARAHLEYGPVAVMDVALPLHHFDGHPGRREPLHRPVALVPSEHLFRGEADGRGLEEDVIRHACSSFAQ